jgi:hypothetical protein
LLCVPPRKLWSAKKYKPIIDISECEPCQEAGKCPDNTNESNVGEDDQKLGKLGNVMDSLFTDDQDPCIDLSDLIGDAKNQNAEGLGVPPDCLKHAGTIMEAVIADALSPSDPSSTGKIETSVAGQNVRNQTIGVG